MHLPFPVARVSVGDPRIADVILLNTTDVYLLGKSVGTTNLIVWNRNNEASIIDLSVSIDASLLQARLAELLPNEKELRVTVAGDTLILSGMVSDTVKADQAMSLANAYAQRGSPPPRLAPQLPVRRRAAAGAAPGPPGGAVSLATRDQPDVDRRAAAGDAGSEGGGSVEDPGRPAGRQPGHEQDHRQLDLFAAVELAQQQSQRLERQQQQEGNFLGLDAQKRDGLIKVLAEPNIMAISGQEASFLAGGKIFIPVSQTNNGGTPTITLEEKEFGVAVKFTPTVLEGGRINLKVSPEVSDLNKEGIGITATGISATAILPSFTTRRATTTVQLFDGQSFAIGGLIKNNVTSNIKALPGLGEVPVLGALFRSTDFQTDRSELVFIITPHLVKPLPPTTSCPPIRTCSPRAATCSCKEKWKARRPHAPATPQPAPMPLPAAAPPAAMAAPVPPSMPVAMPSPRRR